MKKKGLALMLSLALLVGCVPGVFSISAGAQEASTDDGGKIISAPEIPLRLYYDEEASHGIDTDFETREGVGSLGSNSAIKNALDDWENWSIPIGNGHFGANIFGRTDTERIQISEKTLANPYSSWNNSVGGLNSFSETYIDFGHTDVTGYSRELDLKTAVSTVNYTYGGVEYSREYFTSYPDKALVIKLTASEAGKLGFTLRPTVPYEQSWSLSAGDGVSKTGTVTSQVDERAEGDAVSSGTIELSGKLGCYDVDFLGIYRVYTDGELTAATTNHKWTDSDGTEMTDVDGTLVVSGATSAYIYVSLGTDYVVCQENYGSSKPTLTTTLDDTRAKVEEEMNALGAKIIDTDASALASSYEAIKAAHVSDYDTIFGRVDLDLGCDPADYEKTTDVLVSEYRSDTNNSTYLETLLYQYGRYLLIASSRAGALPANLQGVWNKYNYTPWSGGFWHNVNIQMYYWAAFSTNMAETFEPYMEFAKTYMPHLKDAATSLIEKNNPSALNADGGNGWTIGVGLQPFSVGGQQSPGHLGFTTQMFYDYYAFTQDETILPIVFDYLADAARYITKTVAEDEDGNLLVQNCESPEQYHNGTLYFTDGTTYAQSFIYENNYNLIRLAEAMGVDIDDIDASSLSDDDKAILKTVLAQTDRYDPINVGYSGQVKEFREEDYYGDIGEPVYVHISQLVGLYPASIINDSTPAWQDAARVSLAGRGEKTEGWGYAHRMNAYARLGEGEMARLMLHNLIRDSIGNNLWSHYFVYQMDGNGGLTAGITEMLLQSHEGYIEPLAAIPEAWESGSYTGLVARGNFVVSAEWADGLATCFNITSNSGGQASVKYDGIENATVTDSNGIPVPYTAEDGVITFATVKGATYIISGFEAKEEMTAPESLSFSRASFGDFKLATTAVDGAVSYNLYTAVENAATYTKVASSESGYFSYTPAEGEENARTTFRVTAVNANGTESEGTLCYYIPENVDVTVTSVVGNLIGDGIQAVIETSGTASQYKLYAKTAASSDWILQKTSDFPIIILSSYSESIDYAVSAVNCFDGTESEKVVITRFGSSLSEAYDSTNILSTKTFVAGEGASAEFVASYDSGATQTVHGYAKLTDGDTHASAPWRFNRFSTCSGTDGQNFNGICDLGQGYFLGTLSIRDFGANFVGTGMQVFVYSFGTWTQVVDWTRDEILAHRDNGTASAASYIRIDLSGIRAEKLRIYVPSNYGSDTISFYEISCTGVIDTTEYEASDNILSGKTFRNGGTGTETHSGYESSVSATVYYDYTKLTDGNMNYKTGRYSTATESSHVMDALVDLGGEHILGELTLYDFNPTDTTAAFMGSTLSIETCLGGVWTTAKTCASVSEMLEHRVTGSGYLAFDLGGVRADKLRIIVSGTTTVSLYEIKCTGYAMVGATNTIGASSKNILSSTVQLVPTDEAAAEVSPATYDYSKLTDGNFDPKAGRYSSKSGSATQHFDATATFGGYYKLNELRLYDYMGQSTYWSDPKHAGEDLTVQVLTDGVWVTVLEVNEDEYTSHRGGTTSAHGSAYLSFDLGGIVGEAVRIYQSTTRDGVLTDTITYYEIELYAQEYEFAVVNSDRENILAGATDTSVSGTVSESNPISNAFDGKTDTYAKVESDTGSFSVTVGLDSIQALNELRIYENISEANLVGGVLSTASDSTTVEVLRDGTWYTIYTGLTLSASSPYTSIDMCGIDCEKIRITFTNTRLFDGESTYRCAEIAEISCTTSAEQVDRTALLEALEKLPLRDKDNEVNWRYLYNESYSKFFNYATDLGATQDEVDGYAEEVAAYANTITSAILTAYNLSLQGDVLMNFRYTIANADIFAGYPDAYVEFTVPGTVESETVKVYFKDAETDSEGRYVIPVKLPAAQMADDVTFHTVYADGVEGEIHTYSVRDYADYILGNSEFEETYPGVGDLVRSMLNYGAYAQEYFGYNTESLASTGIYTSATDPVLNTSVTEDATMSFTGKANGISLSGWTLSLLSETTARIFFTLADGSDITDFTFTLARGDSEEVLTAYKEGNRYRIDVRNIAAHELDVFMTLVVTNTADASEGSISFSAMCYVSTILSSAGASTEATNLVKALKLYNEAAKAYVMKNS